VLCRKRSSPALTRLPSDPVREADPPTGWRESPDGAEPGAAKRSPDSPRRTVGFVVPEQPSVADARERLGAMRRAPCGRPVTAGLALAPAADEIYDA
jgi:hypothetical protein